MSRPTSTRREVSIAAGVDLVLDTVRSNEPGPTVALLAGVHGDEYEGQLAARILRRRLPGALLRGEVRIVAEANPPAVAAGSRTSPADGANLARVFPGSAAGSVTETIAHVLTTQVIDGCSLLIDLHSAGVGLEMPFLIGYAADQAQQCRPLAREFAAPVIWEHPNIAPGRSLSAAHERGIPAMYVECAGGGAIDGADLDKMTRGVLRVLRHLGMVSSLPTGETMPARLIRGGDGDLDNSIHATSAGWLVRRAPVGGLVGAGTLIAEVFGDQGELVEQVLAPCAAMVMALRRPAKVSAGDVIAMLASVPDESDPAASAGD